MVRTEQSKHWNGHLLCSIDIETSGLDPEKDELLEIAIVPLKPNLTINYDLKPFDIIIQPKWPDNFQNNQILLPGMTLADVMLQGLEAWTAVDLLEQWYEKLNLPERKKIMPLGHNYVAFDRPFLQKWLTEPTYDYIFDYHVRDTMQIGLYLNDLSDYLGQGFPFPKVKLTYMCSCLKIPNMRRHRALGDAVATAELYRQIVTRVGPNLKEVSTLLQCSANDSESGLADHQNSDQPVLP